MITGAYPPARCGVGDYTRELCSSLASAGVAVTVLTSSHLGTRREDGNPGVYPIVRSWSVAHGLKTLRIILGIRSDIYHFQMPSQEYRRRLWPFLLVPLVKTLTASKRVVVTFHELPPAKVRRKPLLGSIRFLRTWLCLLGADAIVVVAESYKKDLATHYKRSLKIPSVVIPIASNIPRSTLTPDQLADARSKLGIKPCCVLLAHFGFINPPKGFEYALDVLATFVRRGQEMKLIVLGELSPHDHYHAQVLRRIAQEGLAEHVKVLGYMDRIAVADHLAMADVCILPFRDGLHPKSTSLLAARTQGTYVVTTSREKFELDESRNVYYARPGDVEGMVVGILQRPDRQSREPSLLKDSWRAVAEQHMSLYDSLIVQSRERKPDICSVQD